MKAIMISIQPQWVEKILNGEKTIEIRKTIPKCELPCKVYIYCTKDTRKILAGAPFVEKSWTCWNRQSWSAQEKKDCGYGKYNGKVVAEFTLNHYNKFDYDGLIFHDMKDIILEHSCLTDEQLCNYIQDNLGYAWHIRNLIIYDKPKELDEFSAGKAKIDCGYGNYDIYNKILKRPPQSWCYVENLDEN